MLPTLIDIRFDTPFAQWVLYLVAVLLFGYGIWAGWRNAPGSVDRKTGKELPPTKEQRTQRAVIYGVLFGALIYLGLRYALPSTAFLGSKGEGFPLHTYGLMLMAGFAAAILVSARLAEREWGGDEGIRRRNDAMDLAVWVVVGGIVGSKILFIIVTPKDFLDALGSGSVWKVLGALGGGFVFYGGLIGAAFAVWWFCRARKIPFLRLADVIVPTVALGQAFGRLGCFAAGCCWGKPASMHLPWAVRFPGSGAVADLFGQHTGGSIAWDSQAQELRRWVIESTGQVFDHPVPGAIRIADWVRPARNLAAHPPDPALRVARAAAALCTADDRPEVPAVPRTDPRAVSHRLRDDPHHGGAVPGRLRAGNPPQAHRPGAAGCVVEHLHQPVHLAGDVCARRDPPGPGIVGEPGSCRPPRAPSRPEPQGCSALRRWRPRP